jgi:hypothetical protein
MYNGFNTSLHLSAATAQEPRHLDEEQDAQTNGHPVRSNSSRPGINLQLGKLFARAVEEPEENCCTDLSKEAA